VEVTRPSTRRVTLDVDSSENPVHGAQEHSAYNLGNLLRGLALPLAIQTWSLRSLQRRLLKTGGRLIRHARDFVPRLAEAD